MAIFLLLKEGISLGRSLAYVIVTSIFDNLFFISATALGFWGVYEPIFASISALGGNMGSSLKSLFLAQPRRGAHVYAHYARGIVFTSQTLPVDLVENYQY